MPAARPTRALTLPAAFVATALTVAACAGGTPTPVPTTLPTSAPTTTAPTPSPTQTEDPNPAGLKPLPADEIDASFVTIENFFTAYEYGLRTGDPSALNSLSAPGCETCETLADNIINVRDLGDRAKGGAFTIKISELKQSLVPGRVAWWLHVSQDATSITHSNGEKTTLKGFDGPVLVEVSPEDAFRITAFDTSIND
ncbi:DUF6318 family protein [Sanguibacter massiliensis]|uniref:DUF6318 family protein n=1 Tax=Sanguibacter massiliensis TaxID=1973217 RepID=UPI0013E9BC01|nr:DUF6318 family protein [Sanguibacter massiliensis]